MSRNAEGLFGLLNSGKRVYRVSEDVVTREEFHAQQLIHTLIFGEKGLADTLGPTWEMIHDPRFEKIENVFIRERKGVFGGDATSGQSKQQPDGSFNAVEDLNQYSEILGEGRYFHSVLRSMAFYQAIITLYPERKFKLPKKETLPGIFMFNRLPAEEQVEVEKIAITYSAFNPHNLHKQSDEALWGLIKQECPNYFTRAGVVNRIGNDLFNMLRFDVVGLIDDYAEVAKIQEWVLLDQEATLVEQKHIDDALPHVWAEVEILERALSYRASLRVTAAQIMKSTGISGMVERFNVDLTEFERDTLLKLIYTSNYPDEIPQLIGTITQYLTGIQFTQQTSEQRWAAQCAKASESSKAYVAKLKSGEVEPINRQTEETEEIELSEEDKVAEQIMLNPIKQMVFIRYSAAEARAEKLRAKALKITNDIDDTYGRALDQDSVTKLNGLREEMLAYAENLDKVVALLAPVFERSDYELTEEAATDLLVKAEEFDSTAMVVVPSPEDVAAAQGEIPVTELNGGSITVETLADGFATANLELQQ